jgi:hypothetical protein
LIGVEFAAFRKIQQLFQCLPVLAQQPFADDLLDRLEDSHPQNAAVAAGEFAAFQKILAVLVDSRDKMIDPFARLRAGRHHRHPPYRVGAFTQRAEPQHCPQVGDRLRCLDTITLADYMDIGDLQKAGLYLLNLVS